MRVLVTGAAGFLGSHLVDKLLLEGHEVIGVDNLFTGSKSNLSGALKNDRFEFLRHDVTFPLYLEVDAIFNLASPASPVHYQRDPVQTIKTNVIGAVNLLGLAKRLKIPILQASTSEVYGDPKVSPQSESYWGNVNPIGPRSCYDEGKRAAETLFFDYHREHGVEVRIVRIFNTYGPRMAVSDGRVVSSFIVQALRGEDITVFGDGSQTRSFCYFSDLIDGLSRAMTTGVIGPMNLGNPTEISIAELANRVLEFTKSRSRLSFLNLPVDDPLQRKPDIEKARIEIGWEPAVGLDDGLAMTIDYFKRELAKKY